MDRRLRVCRLLPPRKCSGALSMTTTDAPVCRAASAAHSPALPPPTTTTSATPSARGDVTSADPVEPAVIEADEWKEPRAAIVKRNRIEVIVEERMLERFAGDAPGDQASQVRRHRHAVAAVAARIEDVVHAACVRHLIACEGDAAAPRVVDRRR